MNLIVYYSRSGNVRRIAESYAEKNGGDLLQIVSQRDYSGRLGFLRACLAAINRRTPIIEQVSLDFSKYTRVVLCGAVWAGTIASPLRTFLKRHGASLPEVEYIILHGGHNDYEDVFAEMDVLLGKQHVAATSLRDGEELKT